MKIVNTASKKLYEKDDNESSRKIHEEPNNKEEVLPIIRNEVQSCPEPAEAKQVFRPGQNQHKRP